MGRLFWIIAGWWLMKKLNASGVAGPSPPVEPEQPPVDIGLEPLPMQPAAVLRSVPARAVHDHWWETCFDSAADGGAFVAGMNDYLAGRLNDRPVWMLNGLEEVYRAVIGGRCIDAQRKYRELFSARPAAAGLSGERVQVVGRARNTSWY